MARHKIENPEKRRASFSFSPVCLRTGFVPGRFDDRFSIPRVVIGFHVIERVPAPILEPGRKAPHALEDLKLGAHGVGPLGGRHQAVDETRARRRTDWCRRERSRVSDALPCKRVNMWSDSVFVAITAEGRAHILGSDP